MAGAPHIASPSDDGEDDGDYGPRGAKLSLLPLVALIFYEVSGGPYGMEDAVKHGGPLLAILGFVAFPLIWSVPEALVTAELGTAFPENGGYVVWISAAFGPFWGFQEGWWKWLSGVIDNSLYPVLFLDYLKTGLPIVAEGPPRWIALLTITALLTYLNYRGLTIVGSTAMALTVFGLLPFVIMTFLAVPLIKPSRWLVCDLKAVNWGGYLNTLFWNLNYWDSVSTLAGEVHKPRKTFPRALFFAILLVCLSYIVPLLAGTGAIPYSPDAWDDGYFAQVGEVIGGRWLFWWIAAAAASSNMGLFEAEMSSDAFQLLGMAERGMLPEAFAYRSEHGTPLLGILCSASGVLLLSWMSFQEIVEFMNFLYCFGMMLEFAAYIWLRVKQPNLDRPYKVPLGTIGVTVMCAIPTALLVVVMLLASAKTVVVSTFVALLGLGIYPLLMLAKREKWLRFVVDTSLPDVATLEGLAKDATEIEHEEEEEVEDGGEESLRDRLLFHSVSGSGGGSGRRRSEYRSSSDIEREGKVFGKEVVSVNGDR